MVFLLSTLQVLVQVLDALQYLHSIGITHRDLKPNHILFYQPARDNVFITGFGLAHIRR